MLFYTPKSITPRDVSRLRSIGGRGNDAPKTTHALRSNVSSYAIARLMPSCALRPVSLMCSRGLMIIMISQAVLLRP